MLHYILLAGAATCFLFAVFIDAPIPWPTPKDKLAGNFACSLGFLLLTLSLLFMAGCDATPTVKSPVKVRWDTPADIPDRYRLYIDGKLASEFYPPGGPVGCNCQQVEVPATPGTHRIALRSVRLTIGGMKGLGQPIEMESTATEITVRVAP